MSYWEGIPGGVALERLQLWCRVDGPYDDSSIRSIENSHRVMQRRVIHMGVSGRHRDCLVASSFLNHLQADPSLS